MRIDKYLKLTRLIKRRTVAKELTQRDLFHINGKVAKPSSEVKIGDFLTLSLGRHRLEVEITSILPYAKKDEVHTMYKVIKDEILEENNND